MKQRNISLPATQTRINEVFQKKKLPVAIFHFIPNPRYDFDLGNILTTVTRFKVNFPNVYIKLIVKKMNNLLPLH